MYSLQILNYEYYFEPFPEVLLIAKNFFYFLYYYVFILVKPGLSAASAATIPIARVTPQQSQPR